MTVSTDAKTLGSAIRHLRKSHGWTLHEMSRRVGIPSSTLAKIERNILSLNYERMWQISRGLNITMSQLLALAETPAELAPVTARRSFGSAGERTPKPTSSHECLCTDIRNKCMLPILSRILPDSPANSITSEKSVGEAFLFVLEGTIEIHMQYYTPLTLNAGCWIYFDRAIVQAIVAKDSRSATVLTVVCDAYPTRTLT
jgi:transcriptional regulator with XRE-family HTH domain